jgi:CRISPR-associated protein Csm1
MANESIALAGLLHDIGKLMLRAEVPGRYDWQDAVTQQDFGYKHAMLSASFAEEFLPPTWRTQVLGPVGYHHRPKARLDRIVQLADHLSAAERDDGLKDEQPRAEHPKQLLSIFCQLEADGQRLTEVQRRYLPLQPLTLSREAIFPDEALKNDDVWRHYKQLWEGFSASVQALQRAHATEGDLPSYLETVLLLFQRYTWCVPSAYYKSLPDISLYDHSRMTAALAAVLDRDEVDDAWLQEVASAPEQSKREVALLVGGDISGVQEFIYTITARGATSSLRGRSFYLQMLTEATARYVLHRLDLPITNLIYAGGGNFYLLARPGDAERLPEIQRQISHVLLHHHRGALYAALASQLLCGEDFFHGYIRNAWGALHRHMQQVKQRRFSELGAEALAKLFAPLDHGGNEKRQCQVCGLEHEGVKEESNGADREPVRKCPSCRAFEDLGDRLRKADQLLLSVLDELPSPNTEEVNLQQPPGKWSDVLAALGLGVDLLDSRRHPVQQGDAERQVLLALDDNALEELQPGARLAVGRRLLVNTTPIFTNDECREVLNDPGFPQAEKSVLPTGEEPVKPFSVLEHQARGIKRLGVLRMDVDDLGKLFQEGLGEQTTLSRVAMLSFTISLYFEGWVARLAEEVNARGRGVGEAPRGRLYAIYAGGDDLFFVGSWDALVELAVAVRRDLTDFAAGHPGIHASAGIALVGGKYPLYQAAADAGEAEEQAKTLRWWDGHQWRRKDAICFLDEPLPWLRFGMEAEDKTPNFDTVHGLMHELMRLGGTGAPKALLRQLTEYYGEYRKGREERRRVHADSAWVTGPQMIWGRWMWRSVYTLKRMEERARNNETLHRGLEDLRTRVEASNYQIIEPLGVAARWAELLQRE